MNMFDDNHYECPAIVEEHGKYFCGIKNEDMFMTTVCHEAACPGYYWIKKLMERVLVKTNG